MLRRHDADDNLRAVERGVQIVGRRDRFWQDESRQEAFVDSTPSDALTNFRFISPQSDFVPQLARRFAPQNNRQPRSPRASSDNGDAAHLPVAPNVPDFTSDSVPDFVPDFVPNFDSVPEARRIMFSQCFQITSAETRAIKISCRGSTYS